MSLLKTLTRRIRGTPKYSVKIGNRTGFGSSFNSDFLVDVYDYCSKFSKNGKKVDSADYIYVNLDSYSSDEFSRDLKRIEKGIDLKGSNAKKYLSSGDYSDFELVPFSAIGAYASLYNYNLKAKAGANILKHAVFQKKNLL